MITAGGKNITPSEIENTLRFSPFIKEAIVIADRRRFVTALILSSKGSSTLTSVALLSWSQ